MVTRQERLFFSSRGKSAQPARQISLFNRKPQQEIVTKEAIKEVIVNKPLSQINAERDMQINQNITYYENIVNNASSKDLAEMQRRIRKIIGIKEQYPSAKIPSINYLNRLLRRVNNRRDYLQRQLKKYNKERKSILKENRNIRIENKKTLQQLYNKKLPAKTVQKEAQKGITYGVTKKEADKLQSQLKKQGINPFASGTKLTYFKKDGIPQVQVTKKTAQTTAPKKEIFLPTQIFSNKLDKILGSKTLNKAENSGIGAKFWANVVKGGVGSVKQLSDIISFTTVNLGSKKERKKTVKKINSGVKTIKGVNVSIIKKTAKKAGMSVASFLSQSPKKVASQLAGFTGAVVGGTALAKITGVGIRTPKIIKSKKLAKVLAETEASEALTVTAGKNKTTLGAFLQKARVAVPKAVGKGYKKSKLVVTAGKFGVSKVKGIKPLRVVAKGKQVLKSGKLKALKKSVSFEFKLNKKYSQGLTKKGIESLSENVVKSKDKEIFIQAVRKKGKVKGFNVLTVKKLPRTAESKGFRSSFSGNVGLVIKGQKQKGITSVVAKTIDSKIRKNLEKKFAVNTVRIGKGKKAPVLLKLSPKKSTKAITTYKTTQKTISMNKAKPAIIVKSKQNVSVTSAQKTKIKQLIKQPQKYKIKSRTKLKPLVITAQKVTPKESVKLKSGTVVLLKQGKVQKLKQLLKTVSVKKTTSRAGFFIGITPSGKRLILPLPSIELKGKKRRKKGRKRKGYITYNPSLFEALLKIKGKKPAIIGAGIRKIPIKRKR